MNKHLLALTSLTTVIAPTAIVISCGKQEDPSVTTLPPKVTITPPEVEQSVPAITPLEAFDNLLENLDVDAPAVFQHFTLPETLPPAPENTHYEFNNDQLYSENLSASEHAPLWTQVIYETADETDQNQEETLSATTDQVTEVEHFWTKDISNFIMLPSIDEDTIVFNVRVAPDKGYVLEHAENANFELNYNVLHYIWNDPSLLNRAYLYEFGSHELYELYGHELLTKKKNPDTILVQISQPWFAEQTITIDGNVFSAILRP